MLRTKSSVVFNQLRSLGSIKSAGGSMAKRGEGQEEEYFRKKRHEQLNKLKAKQVSEKDFVAEQIQIHQEAVDYHKRMIEDFKSGKKLQELKKDF